MDRSSVNMKTIEGSVAGRINGMNIPRCKVALTKGMAGLMRIFFLLTLPSLLLGGCMIGPDFVRPEASVEQEWLQQRDARIKTETANTANWWTVFNDPVLNSLVQKAGEQNLDLRVAALRIMEARARLGIAKGFQYPQQQNAGAQVSVNQLSENAPNMATASRYYSDYSFGFDAAWELDFWGRFRRGVESETAGLYAAMADYDSMLVSLTAEVARTYVVIRTTERRLEYTRDNIALQKESLRIANERYRLGASSELDVTQAAALLKQTEAAIPQLEAQLRQARNSMAVLLGILPSEVDALITGPGQIPSAPSEVAVGMPAELLRRRPDIRFAEFQAAAQSARIGVAKADLLPRFSLVGSIGLQSSSMGGFQSNNAHFGDIFSADSITYFIGPTVQWPVFNYGRLKNNVRMQDARFQELVETYKNTVLKAAREVEDATVGFLRSQETDELLKKSVSNYQRSVDLSVLQYQNGETDYQRVVDAQRYLTRAQDDLASTSGAVAENLIAIYKAIGGGWELRNNMEIIPQKTLDEMKERTDWGGLLEKEKIPDETENPPTGQAVPVISRPEW